MRDWIFIVYKSCWHLVLIIFWYNATPYCTMDSVIFINSIDIVAYPKYVIKLDCITWLYYFNQCDHTRIFISNLKIFINYAYQENLSRRKCQAFFGYVYCYIVQVCLYNVTKLVWALDYYAYWVHVYTYHIS